MSNRIQITVGLLIISYINTYALTEGEKDESRRDEAAQVALWEKKLEDTQSEPDELKMSELWLGLRNMGYRKSYPGYSPSVNDIYLKLQAELLSIPGHAEFYSKPILESYAAYRDPNHPEHSGSANRFSWETQIGMETLKHLPSPETVKVLGDMLGEEWEADRSGGPRESDLAYPSALAYQAAWTLLDLPLRDRPTPFFERYAVKENLPAWQAWYEQVKSGEITFSFKGESVEYRFNPDGTWQTIPIANPPDDAPEPPVLEKSESKPERQAKELENPRETKKPIWVWIVTTGLMLGGILLWFLTKRNPANGNA